MNKSYGLPTFLQRLYFHVKLVFFSFSKVCFFPPKVINHTYSKWNFESCRYDWFSHIWLHSPCFVCFQSNIWPEIWIQTCHRDRILWHYNIHQNIVYWDSYGTHSIRMSSTIRIYQISRSCRLL